MYGKYLCIILCITAIACRSKTTKFKFSPVGNKVYNYSITKTSTQEWAYQNVPHQTFDTTYIDISLLGEKKDSGITYKLTFNNLKIVPRPFKFTIINSTNKKIIQYNPYIILDSICASLKDLSVEVDITEDGNVTGVHGMDELVANISRTSKIEANTVRRSLSDYVSENAIQDLLNRLLSIPRNQEIKASDSWVEQIILITKAPIKLSNIYTVEKIMNDSVFINIKSFASTVTDKGGNVYLQGKQEGEAILSLPEGMPYKYQTHLQTTTKTNYYDVVYNEYLTVRIY